MIGAVKTMQSLLRGVNSFLNFNWIRKYYQFKDELSNMILRENEGLSDKNYTENPLDKSLPFYIEEWSIPPEKLLSLKDDLFRHNRILIEQLDIEYKKMKRDLKKEIADYGELWDGDFIWDCHRKHHKMYRDKLQETLDSAKLYKPVRKG